MSDTGTIHMHMSIASERRGAIYDWMTNSMFPIEVNLLVREDGGAEMWVGDRRYWQGDPIQLTRGSWKITTSAPGH